MTETILDRFHKQAIEEPDRLLYVFVDSNGNDQEKMTSRQLFDVASSLASFLSDECNLNTGDRALLVYSPSLEFIKAFVGCMLGGFIPVPVSPPNPFQLKEDIPAFQLLAEDCGAKVILTNAEYQRAKRSAGIKNIFNRPSGHWANLPWYTTDNIGGDVRSTIVHRPSLDDLAFLQYTSGSTSQPKGVMISHRNIMHQLSFNAQVAGFHPYSIGVLWIPHFHDFGLISGILNALFGNGLLYTMSPLSFIKDPAIWFKVMSRVRATHTAAPDFAYRLAVRKTNHEQRSQWDLSSLHLAMSAAEPVRPSTVDQFLEAFEASSFPREAYCPSYGLAEHTVGVTVFGKGRITVDRRKLEQEREIQIADGLASEETLTLIGCGTPVDGIDVRIVDPESAQECERGFVGEIWINSPSKAIGYWGRPSLSRELLEAKIAGGPEGIGYLRTGDLGAIYQDELYITGRIKDLIIIRGRNLYPQDLEESVNLCAAEIRPGRTVVFSVPHPNESPEEYLEEQIVVIAEVRTKKMPVDAAQKIVRQIRRRLMEEHQAICYAVLITRPGVIQKTSSGKLKRQSMRQAFLEGSFQDQIIIADTLTDIIATPDYDFADISQPSIVEWNVEALEKLLVTRFAQTLQVPVEYIDPQAPLESYPVDSLVGVSLISELSDHLGAPISPRVLLEFPNISAVAKFIHGQHNQRERASKTSDAGIEDPAYLLSQMDQLSDEEIAELLDKRMGGNMPHE